MKTNYLFDTTAIFTYLKDEKGNETIEDLLRKAKARKCEIKLSFMSIMEVGYIAWRAKGRMMAKQLTATMKKLPIDIIHSNDALTLLATRLKANYRLSLADAMIAATAIEYQATLVHKDPELEIISKYVETLVLPYKNIPRKRSK